MEDQQISDQKILDLLKNRPDLLNLALKNLDRSSLKKLLGSPAALLPHMAPSPKIKPEYAKLDVSGLGLQILIDEWDFDTVVDIGSGEGAHSKILREKGKKVTEIDLGKSIYFQKSSNSYSNVILGDFNSLEPEETYDCVWASHILEHQPNVQSFINRLCSWIKPKGILAITVPPLKFEVVGGHLSLWTPGHLLYNLVFSGINCREAQVFTYHYNITVIVRNETFSLPELTFDYGDVGLLQNWLPPGFYEGVDGFAPDFMKQIL